MMSNAARLIFILLILLNIGGCFSDDLSIQVRFDQNPGLKAKDAVYFQGNQIGTVTKVTYTDKGDYLMDVSINSDFKNAATVDSKFYIENSANDADKKRLVIEQAKPGGKVLEDKAMVQGSAQKNFFNTFINNFAADIQAAVETIRQEIEKNSGNVQSGAADTINKILSQFETFKQEISKVPEREEVKKLGNQLEKLRQDMMSCEKSVRQKIQQDIIPQMEKELETLKNQLSPKGRENEVDPLEQKLDEIKKV